MNRYIAHIALLLLSALLVAACDLANPDDFQEEYVVESYQVVGEPLGQVRLTRTAPLDVTYDAEALAVRGADVRVDLLAADGSVDATMPFRNGRAAGVYEPVDDEMDVLPLRTYRLHVETENGDVITAETLTPENFVLQDASADTVTYQAEEQLDLIVTRSSYPGRQNIYIFTTEALGALSVDRLTTLYRSLFDNNEDLSLEDLRISASPLLNEANYEVRPDEITIFLPWIAVAYLGENKLTASALDDNIYDFIRSQTAQQQGSTLSPGETPNVIEHVEGGTGVFGSLARTTFEVFILPKE